MNSIRAGKPELTADSTGRKEEERNHTSTTDSWIVVRAGTRACPSFLLARIKSDKDRNEEQGLGTHSSPEACEAFQLRIGARSRNLNRHVDLAIWVRMVLFDNRA